MTYFLISYICFIVVLRETNDFKQHKRVIFSFVWRVTSCVEVKVLVCNNEVDVFF